MLTNNLEQNTQQQHASSSKGSAIRARMLRGKLTAKMVRGLRFPNFLQKLSTHWTFYFASLTKALNESCEAQSIRFSHFARQQNLRGFGMIETVVAIGILTVAVSAAISLASRGIASSIIAREEITAFYLGIEAVEVIRNERDENVLEGKNWIQGLPGSCFQSHGCTVEVDGSKPKFIACSSTTGCPSLRYDEANNTYNLNRGDLTSFRRKIQLKEVVSDRELHIIVEIEWKAGLFTPTPIIIEETLMNWSG